VPRTYNQNFEDEEKATLRPSKKNLGNLESKNSSTKHRHLGNSNQATLDKRRKETEKGPGKSKNRMLQ